MSLPSTTSVSAFTLFSPRLRDSARHFPRGNRFMMGIRTHRTSIESEGCRGLSVCRKQSHAESRRARRGERPESVMFTLSSPICVNLRHLRITCLTPSLVVYPQISQIFADLNGCSSNQSGLRENPVDGKCPSVLRPREKLVARKSDNGKLLRNHPATLRVVRRGLCFGVALWSVRWMHLATGLPITRWC